MIGNVGPSKRAQQVHFILHVGTNNIISNVPPNEIARKVVDGAGKLKSEKFDVTITKIILTDKPGLNNKKNT